VRNVAQPWPEQMPDLPVPDGEISARPGVVRILDHGVPWIRTRTELWDEWAALDDTAVGMVRARGVDGLNVSEKALTGLWRCARWTLGFDAVAPAQNRARPVTGASLRTEISWSASMSESRLEGWEWATGVLFWLLWATGANEDLDWPGWEASHAPVKRWVS